MKKLEEARAALIDKVEGIQDGFRAAEAYARGVIGIKAASSAAGPKVKAVPPAPARPASSGRSGRLGVAFPDDPYGNFEYWPTPGLTAINGRNQELGQGDGRFGYVRTYPSGRPKLHQGIDIAAPVGSKVVAADDGVVVFAGPRGDYGLTIDIDHGGGRVTRYAHLDGASVKRGDKVLGGQVFASSGRSGNVGRATPHLHYETRINGRLANPQNNTLLDRTMLNGLPADLVDRIIRD